MLRDLKPTDNVGGFDVRPGNFLLNGATTVSGGVNFTIHSVYAVECTLLLFRPYAKFPYARLRFPDSYKIGNTYSMLVFGLDEIDFEYAYSFDGPYEPEKGIIFDMDGTLWDSAANVAESWNLAIKQDGSVDKKLTEQDIQGVMGKTMDVIADILFPEMEKEARMKLLDQCCSMENDYLREHGGVLYPKLEETLSALKEKYPLYIVSNCQSGYIEAFLDHYGFGKYFEDIECYGNNLRQKGDNIRLLADRNGLTEAVYVGDIQGDYDASCHAGVGFIHAAYGFGTIAADVPEIHTFEELTETADQYFALR